MSAAGRDATPATDPAAAPRRPWTLGDAAQWWALVPLWLLLHPYGGLLQDARIYIGRGVADRDPAGVGRDIMFAHDQQTGFSLMHGLVGAVLGVTGAGQAALLLALAGALAWAAGAIALARGLATGRVAWAAVVCMMALPSRYGGFGIFDYAETLATPRVFAQAAVMGALAALLSRRPRLAMALLALAAGFHPLIALPGIGIAVALLVRADRRWLIPVALCAAALGVAAVLGFPVARRLVARMDDPWLGVLRRRSIYLFPSLWPAEAFGPVVFQATAALAAAALSPRRIADLLLATLAVALLGLGASWLLGDLWPGVLVLQLQPWRALWLLALLGNAAFALAVAGLGRRGPLGWVGVALLGLTWLSRDQLPLAAVAAVLTLLAVAALRRGAAVAVSRAVAAVGIVLVLAVALASLAGTGSEVVALLRFAARDGATPVWPMAVALGVATIPVVLGALVVACRPSRPRGRAARLGAVAAALCATAAAAWLWDARSPAQRGLEAGLRDAALDRAIGTEPGEVLWIDEDSQAWFLAGRPSFFNAAQAGPILFSRDLALDWSARAGRLLALGLTRPENVEPWANLHRDARDLPLTAESVGAFCADPRRPAALVAPGDQRAAVLPTGLVAGLWRPPVPMRRLVVAADEVRWQVMSVFTVVRCRAAPAGMRQTGDD